MELKIMTFNLRVRSKLDGENILENRQNRILEVIRNEMPDIIGFQEAKDPISDFMRENLPAYCFVGHGRDADYSGEAPLIAYRWDKFYLHGFDQEMLSLEPQKPGSMVDAINQSPYPRAFACAELVCRENSKRFAFCNIHTDHVDQTVVFAECVMLMQYIGRRALPFVLTGDFNAKPDTLAIQMINGTYDTMGTVDATANIQVSFHGYGQKEERKIDYIFTNLKTDPARAYAVPNTADGYYSDHFALCAEIEIG